MAIEEDTGTFIREPGFRDSVAVEASRLRTFNRQPEGGMVAGGDNEHGVTFGRSRARRNRIGRIGQGVIGVTSILMGTITFLTAGASIPFWASAVLVAMGTYYIDEALDLNVIPTIGRGIDKAIRIFTKN